MTTVREPQQARSHETRRRLVEAAAAALAELGHPGATTTAVAERAGVSHGALFKHFPTKTALVTAGVAHLLARFVAAFRSSFPEKAGARAALDLRLRTAVRGLWAIFRRPEMLAVFQVYLAARTDADLAAELGPILERHRLAILAEARRLFPREAGVAGPAFDGAVDALVYAMQGAALGVFSADEKADAGQIAFFERLAAVTAPPS